MRYSLVKVLLTVSPFRPSFFQPPVVHSTNNRFFTPLFSASSELLFSQLFCFHNHLRCPLVFRSILQPANVPTFKRANSRRFILLQPLGFLFRAPVLCFQSFAAFFARKGGWGTPSRSFPPVSRSKSQHSRVTGPRLLGTHESQTTSHKSRRQWAIIGAINHVQSSQTRSHQGRAVQHVPGQGNNQTRLRQSARTGSYPQHAPSRHRPWSLDLRTQVPRVRPSLWRQRKLHPQPQMPQVPGRPARPAAVAFSPVAQGGVRGALRLFSDAFLLLCFTFRATQIRQEHRQDSHRRQKRTHVIHKADVRRIRQFSEQRRADSAQPKRQPEERSRYRPHFRGHQLLRENQNRGKRRRQNQSNNHAQNSRPEQIRVRQDQRERQHAQYRIPDHHFASHAVAHRPAKKCSRRHRAKKRKQMNLRAPNRHVKLVHQIKRVVRTEARQVKIFRKHQRHQDRQRPHNFLSRQMPVRFSGNRSNNVPSQRRRRAQLRLRRSAFFGPGPDIRKQNNSQQPHKRKPRNAPLPARQNKRRQQRPQRRSRVSSHLKQRLRHAVLSARSHARHARRLRTKYGRPHSPQSRRNQYGRVTGRERQRDQPDQRNPHANRQEIRFVMPVAVQPHQRLQQRCRERSGERDQPNLPEIQMKRVSQQRINRRQQRLHRVIQQMTKANRQQNLKDRFGPRVRASFGSKCIHFAFTRHFPEPASNNEVHILGKEFFSEKVVGSWGLEPQTSTVSRWRSNQLSYEPRRALVYHGDGISVCGIPGWHRHFTV